jgi:Tol biopolymer transport system component
MELSSGQKLGPYEVLAHIGAGGMGDVWKARDSRLDRVVALKVSRVEFSERFEREARLVAALNHPHICTLFDVGPDYLVMEFVEGRPIAGPLPVRQAIEYASQILDALDCAHSHAVVHRDLKPANVLLGKQGIKLLDFGLARQNRVAGLDVETQTDALTREGQIVGTLQYMSPEQLHGREADVRSDIFSFGCLLYEVLTGKRAFDGSSAASIIAAILEREPPSLVAHPPLDRILRKCLAKEPDQRFQNVRDLKAVLLWSLEEPPATTPPSSRRSFTLAAIAVAVGVCALGGWAIGRWTAHRDPVPLDRAQFAIVPPPETSLLEGAVSPDGKSFAFIGVDKAGNKQIWLRKTDSATARAIAPAAFPPFWSPDSRYVAYGSDGRLMKLDIAGGAPQPLCNAPLVIGGSWNRDQTIIFSGSIGGGPEIFSVSAAGGEARRVTTLDLSRGDTQHVYPFFLPDGRHFVYTVQSLKGESGGIYVGSLDRDTARVRLLPDISTVQYSPLSPAEPDSGYLMFARGEVLMAQPFDARSYRVSGDAFTVLPRILRSASSPRAGFSVSANGIILASTPFFGDQLVWFDRNGNRMGVVGPPALHFYPRLSPDERTLVVDVVDRETFAPHLWLFPLNGGAPARFSFIPSLRPVWSPGGDQVLFEGYDSAFYVKNTAGAETETIVLPSGHIPDANRQPCEYTRDGKFVIYSEFGPQTGYDLWMAPLTRKGAPVSLLRNEFNERCGSLSPDGRWMAYSSDESGRPEVYVQAFSGGLSGRKWQVSYAGGRSPRWRRRDAREIFFIGADNGINAASVSLTSGFHSESPRVLFSAGIYSPDATFDVTADGQRFIMPSAAGVVNAEAPLVILNWRNGGRQDQAAR